MFSKALVALAAASIVGQAVASPHKHGLQHAHQKRALVTEVVTVTDWVTVTVTEGDTNTAAKVFYTNSRKYRSSASSASTSTSSQEPSTTVSAVPQVSTSSTLEQGNQPTVEAVPSPTSSTSSAISSSTSTPEVVNAPAPTSEAPSPTIQAAPTSEAPSPTDQAAATSAAASPAAVETGNVNTGGSTSTGGSTTSTGRRGLSYNNPSLLKSFLSSGTKVSWAYNWGQYDDSGTDLEFVPMLWGLKLDFAETWPANAQKAIDAGSKCLFSFNEPDLGAQANLSPSVAAAKHIELMNPFSGKARIGAPAITNSGADGQGISWLQQFFTACAGQCAVDFVNVHIYGVDTNAFLAHLRNVHDTFNKPVWITEFAFDGTDDQINAQLETVIDQIENNATYSFVERYSYFMVQDGTMVKGGSPSKYGNTFAYGA